MTRHIIEAIQIHVEESLYDHVAVGAMDVQAAKFLASHPTTMQRWQEEGDYLRRLEQD